MLMAKSLEKRRHSLWLDLSDQEVKLMPASTVSSMIWISSASEDEHLSLQSMDAVVNFQKDFYLPIILFIFNIYNYQYM